MNTLNTDQLNHFNKILTDIEICENDGNFDYNPYLITGKAGTGKSYLASTLIKHFVGKGLKVQCTALTHKALKEISKKVKIVGVHKNELNGLSTVHSYFRIKPVINFKTGVEEFKVQESGRNKPKKCDILFIDECSMICPELYNLIQQQRHLFKHLIFIGDEFQIPSVNDKNDFNLFKDNNIIKYKLTEIVRQAKNNPIIMLASDIVEKIENKNYRDKAFCIKKIEEYSRKYNEIEYVNSSQEFIQKYYDFVKEDAGKNYNNSKFSEAIITTFTNRTVDSYNNIAKCLLKKINLPSLNYIDINDVLVLQEPAFDFYIPDDIVLNNNSEFLVVKLEDDTYEGIPIYKATNQNDESIRIIKPQGLSLFNVKLKNLTDKAKIDGRMWKKFYDFKKCFTEVKQSFACTTHKVQGSTYRYSFVDLKDMPWVNNTDLAFRLCYVAVTRASEKVICKN